MLSFEMSQSPQRRHGRTTVIERVAEIYHRYVKPLSAAERLELVESVVHDLGAEVSAQPTRKSILGLAGLGKEIWEGIDAHEYVNQLRRDWNNRL
jgi:hypothetical protein